MSFGSAATGKVTTSFGLLHSGANAVALDASTPVPTIVAAGQNQSTSGGGFTFSLARYFE